MSRVLTMHSMNNQNMKHFITTTLLMLGVISPAMASNADRFGEQDPIGWMMAVIAMGVVFVALVILFFCFKYLYPALAWCGLQLMKGIHRKKQYEQITDRRANASIQVTDSATGKAINNEELAAAIGMALFLHEDGMHDQESGVLTLAPSSSAWTGAGNNHKGSPLRKF